MPIATKVSGAMEFQAGVLSSVDLGGPKTGLDLTAGDIEGDTEAAIWSA